MISTSEQERPDFLPVSLSLSSFWRPAMLIATLRDQEACTSPGTPSPETLLQHIVHKPFQQIYLVSCHR
jgi:hypothetical protein